MGASTHRDGTSDATASDAAARSPKLRAKDVDKQAQSLYGRLFGRSVVVAGLVFGLVNLVGLTPAPRSLDLVLLLLSLPLTFGGYALVEGTLVQLVRGLHEDGDHRPSSTLALRGSLARLRPLVGVSTISGLGIMAGTLLLVVPGLVLLTRWAVAIPVVVLEGCSTREALARSRALVRGNGRAVLNVMLSVGLLTGIVNLLFSALGRGHGLLGMWLSSTLAATLTVPYAAHAVSVLYYRLSAPERPVVLERGTRWQSVWELEGSRPAAAE